MFHLTYDCPIYINRRASYDSTHCQHPRRQQKTPVIKLKGVWLKEVGFKEGDKIAVCTDKQGKITILNMDTQIQKWLEEEFQDLVIMI